MPAIEEPTEEKMAEFDDGSDVQRAHSYVKAFYQGRSSPGKKVSQRSASIIPSLLANELDTLKTSPGELMDWFEEVKQAELSAARRGKGAYCIGDPPGLLEFHDVVWTEPEAMRAERVANHLALTSKIFE